MTSTFPSVKATVVDIPEVRGFTSNFVYDFYVQDESANEKPKYSQTIVKKLGANVSDAYFDYASSRVPRYVKLAWRPIIFTNRYDETNGYSPTQEAAATFDADFLKRNLKFILSEDDFSYSEYTTVSFDDNELASRVQTTVSSSHSLNQTIGGAPIYDQSGKLKTASMKKNPSQSGYRYSANKKFAVRGIDDVKLTMSMKTKFSAQLLHEACKDPSSFVSTNLIATATEAAKFTSVSKTDPYAHLSQTYDTNTNSILSTDAKSATASTSYMIGYIIDKHECLPSGDTRYVETICVSGYKSYNYADVNILYGKTYVYSIRAVCSVAIPTIDEDGKRVLSRYLIASKPVRSYVDTVEETPPPAVNDLSFNWDYEHKRLMVHWTLPVNKQRDIVKFQIMRRRSITEPYEILKIYDFDKSAVKVSDVEGIPSSIVQKLNSPLCYYIDDEFVVSYVDTAGITTQTSKFIYAVCCVDAHGFISNYSEQFSVTFDVFKNKLLVKRISRSGAPRVYPNVYVETNAFVDNIDENCDQMTVTLSPDAFTLTDTDDMQIKHAATTSDGSYYVVGIIDVKNGDSDSFNIELNDSFKAQSKIKV